MVSGPAFRSVNQGSKKRNGMVGGGPSGAGVHLPDVGGEGGGEAGQVEAQLIGGA
jgi:hypothetical protein